MSSEIFQAPCYTITSAHSVPARHHPISRVLQSFFLLLVLTGLARADAAPFDLIGPPIDVKVERAGETLPISEVPNLQAGDRVWIHADLPDSQSAHYLMVIVFLRGATNPPPEGWFTRVETWDKSVREEGVYVTVPEEAQEALILLAPDTGGAFSTVRAAVRGKPGVFVRAAQDLEQASLDRARLEKYLESVRDTSTTDPEELKAHTVLLARSLSIRLDQQCFDKPTAQQVPCLTQNTDQLVLDDAHSQSMVATLTTGAPVDLVGQISATPTARGGYYGAYVGAVVDVARILASTRTAQYQYIPALALPKREELNLRMNNPPSFRNPKSVLVVALPLIRTSPFPPLRTVDGKQASCLEKPDLVLPVEGAGLVFATELAHNFSLRVPSKKGDIDLPAKPDPAKGGFVVDSSSVKAEELEGDVKGVLHGFWGFQPFEGPRFQLKSSRPAKWIVASKDASALIIGREDTLHVQSADTACVSQVKLSSEAGKSIGADWKISKPEELEVKVALQDATAGWVTMEVKQFGLPQPDQIRLHTYAEASRLDGFYLHAGDSNGILKGTRLDQVTAVDLGGVSFSPTDLSRDNQQDSLKLSVKDSSVDTKLQPGTATSASVTLKDGRTLDVKVAVDSPRPKVTLISKNVQIDSGTTIPVVHFSNQDDLPQEGHLSFFLKTQVPEAFQTSEKVEVATADESFRVLLSMADGNLTLQDSKTVFAMLDPLKHLGPSAFGPLKFRPVTADGAAGDWQPLVNLVRIPHLRGVHCVEEPEKQCALVGEKLFLIDAVSVDPDFADPVPVPDGFVETALVIPPLPKGKTIYFKLRDAPATVDSVVMPAVPSAQP